MISAILFFFKYLILKKMFSLLCSAFEEDYRPLIIIIDYRPLIILRIRFE
jgi:hypothetical protein